MNEMGKSFVDGVKLHEGVPRAEKIEKVLRGANK
jgi:hypothetical protein